MAIKPQAEEVPYANLRPSEQTNKTTEIQGIGSLHSAQ